MDTKKFILENAIMPKIRAALEAIEVGQGYIVFEGIETGVCNLAMVYDGNNITFHKLERLKPVEVSLPVVEPAKAEIIEVPIVVGPHSESEVDKPLKRRRTFKDHNVEDE